MRSIDVAYCDKCRTHVVRVCWSQGCCAKTAKMIEMLFGWAATCGPKEPCIRWGLRLDATRADKSMMRPFAKLLWTVGIAHEI